MRQGGRLRNRRGAVLAVVAVSLVVLLGITALAIDMGMAYSARNEAQRVADAAALAGASAYLDFTPPYTAIAKANERAQEYLDLNEILSEPVDSSVIDVMPAQQRVRVTVVQGQIATWFARVFGIDSIRVDATAVAEAVNAGQARCVRPWAVQDLWHEGATDDRPLPTDRYDPAVDEYVPALTQPDPNATGYGARSTDNGKEIVLKTQVPVHGNEDTELAQPGPGEFMIWSMPEDPTLENCTSKSGSESGSTGSPSYIYRNSICECNNSPIAIQTDYGPYKPGNVVGPTELGLDSLINKDPTAYWDLSMPNGGGVHSPYGDASPRIIRLGLIEPLGPPDGQNWTMANMPHVTFTNFADMFVEGFRISGRGADRVVEITARFMYYATGEPGPNTGTLVKYLRLVE